MLNPFPIQFLSMLAYLLLRFFVGTILIYLGLSHYRHRAELKNVLILSWWPYGTFTAWIFAATELFVGIFIIAGAYTQYVAIIIMIMSLKMMVLKKYFRHPTIPERLFYVLLFAAALSLFITGAGAFAFDLPI